VFAQTAGVGLSYTANFTSVAASQDPLSAAFPWIGTSTLTTSNDSGYGSLMASVSTVVTSTSNVFTSASSSSYGSLMNTLTQGSTQAATVNVASLVPTNTGGTTTMALFSDAAVNSYSSYLAQIYGLAYGSQNTNANINPNAYGSADPIPEPSSYVSMGLGLAAVLAYARHRKSK